MLRSMVAMRTRRLLLGQGVDLCEERPLGRRRSRTIASVVPITKFSRGIGGVIPYAGIGESGRFGKSLPLAADVSGVNRAGLGDVVGASNDRAAVGELRDDVPCNFKIGRAHV